MMATSSGCGLCPWSCSGKVGAYDRGLSMRYGDFLGSLSLASSHSGGFPYSVEHMAGEGQPAQAARPNIVHVYGACAVCRCVLVRIYGGVFVRDSGRSL